MVSAAGKRTRTQVAIRAGARKAQGVANSGSLRLPSALGAWGRRAEIVSAEIEFLEGLHHRVRRDLAEQRLLRGLRPDGAGEVGGGGDGGQNLGEGE